MGQSQTPPAPWETKAGTDNFIPPSPAAHRTHPGRMRLHTRSRLPGIIDFLQLISQVPCVVVVQCLDEILHPALAAPQVLIEPKHGCLVAPCLFPGKEFILGKTHRVSKRGSGLEISQLYVATGEGAWQSSGK